MVSSFPIFSLAVLATLFLPAFLSATECQPMGQLVVLRGDAEVKRVGDSRWLPVQAGESFCSGDSLRVKRHATGGLRFHDDTLLRLDGGATLTFPENRKEESAWVTLLRGAIYLMTRDPHGLQVTTPFYRAAVDGTEFTVEVTQQDALTWVMEGRVRVKNALTEVALSAGEAARGGGGGRFDSVVMLSSDAVQWALYYPPLVNLTANKYGVLSVLNDFRQALDHFRKGDIGNALLYLEAVPVGYRNADYQNVKAGILLSSGKVKQAANAIDKSLKSNPANGVAYALQSIIALSRGEKARASRLVEEAIQLSPDDPVTLVAHSYTLQAMFKLEEALMAASRAADLSNDARAWARVSELSLSTGDYDAALAAGLKAVDLNPERSYAQAALGLVYLVRGDVVEAKKYFHTAIQRDPQNPLPRLGMGLAKIKQGALIDGRRDIEIAVLFDPLNALLRSYLGKAYFAEKRVELAEKQFALAKQLDPADPTPWLYNALLQLSENQPAAALTSGQRSRDLNNNRGIYRSKSLLEQDNAVRSVVVGRAWQALGFDQLMLLEGERALAQDRDNYAGHKLLADHDRTRPGAGVAFPGQLRQAGLRQPPGALLTPGSMAIPQLPVTEDSSLVQAGFNEYTSLFSTDRMALSAHAFAGSQSTFGDAVSFGKLKAGSAIRLSQLHYGTEGFDPNQDFRFDQLGVAYRRQPSFRTHYDVEWRLQKQDMGDRTFRLSGFVDPDFRYRSDQKSINAGLRHALSSQSSVLFNVQGLRNQNRMVDKSTTGLITLKGAGEIDAYSAELQHHFQSKLFSTQIGLRALNQDGGLRLRLNDLPEFNDESYQDAEWVSAYGYASYSLGEDFFARLGVSIDRVRYFNQTLEQGIAPKLGLMWRPAEGKTTLRLAAFESIQRGALLLDQSLQPTRLAGFSQQFTAPTGSKARQLGMGWDQTVSERVFVGVEAVNRDLKRRDHSPDRHQEDSVSAYAYWLARDDLAFGMGFEFSDFSRNQTVFSDPCRLMSQQIPLSVRYFHSDRWQLGLQAAWVKQDSQYPVDRLSKDCHQTALEAQEETFAILDTNLRYLFPQRRGYVGITAQNLTNEAIHFQDDAFRSDTLTSSLGISANLSEPVSYSPGRAVLARILFQF